MTAPEPGTACANGCRVRGTTVPIRTDPPLKVCRRCHHRAEDALQDIRRRWALLPAFVARGSLPGEDSEGRIPSAANAPLPVRVEAVSLTDWRGNLSVPHFLHTWAVFCREGHNITAQPADPMGDLGLLEKHLRWALSQDARMSKTLCAALGRMARTLGDVVGERRPQKVGTCRAEVATTDGVAECGGPLLPQTHDFGVYCPLCGDVWGRDDLRGLGIVLAEQEDQGCDDGSTPESQQQR